MAERSSAALKNLHGKVGVVTVTYNSGGVLPDFYESLRCQTYKDFMVFVVDNASSDNTTPQLSGWKDVPFVLLANLKNLGVAAANNQGIQRAYHDGCDTVLLINNDVVFGPDLFERLLNGLSVNNCDMTTPLIYYSGEPTKIWAAGGGFQSLLGYRPYHIGENDMDRGQFQMPRKIQYAPTCCVLVRMSVFEVIGVMDERYFVYSDDVDFMYRAMRAGLKLYLLPEAKLWHKVSGLTGGALSEFSLYYGSRGRALFLYKHFGRLQGWFWTTLYSAFCWLRQFVGGDAPASSKTRIRGTRDGRRVGASRFLDLRLQ